MWAMSTALSYINEKFRDAVYALATGQGDIKSRIDLAYHCYSHIPAQDLPPALAADHAKVIQLLSFRGGTPGYIIPENLTRMTNQEASEIAILILGMYEKL